MDERREQQQQQERGEDAMEQPVAVKVQPPTLLDFKAEVLRSNPSLFFTSFSTLLAAALLGLCFAIVGIPPLYIASVKGRQTYVAIMLPLLTVIGTVLSYYCMQHPQRMFNSALAHIVKEMEHHAAYLSTAVGYVETELETRGVNLSMAVTAKSTSMRSLPATPKERGLQRLSNAVAPGGAAAAPPTTIPAVGGSGFLRGIDALEEERDMIIATVHVGKEWRWLMGLLGKLNLRSLAGPTNPALHHQRIAVCALVTSVARVERMILSLYFSSFVLQRVNTISPVNLRGLPVSTSCAGGGPASNSAVGVGYGDARTTAPMLQSPMPVIASVRLHSPRTSGRELGDSLTESVFTIPRETANESGDGAEDGVAGEETTSQLTSLNVRGINFGGVKLVQFPPLLSGKRASREHKKRHANAQEEPPAAAAVASASTPIARTLHMDPDVQSTGDREGIEERALKLGRASSSDHTMRSFEGTHMGASDGDQRECSGEATPPERSIGQCESAVNPSYSHTATLCVQSRTVAAVSSAWEVASTDGNRGEEVALSPGSGISTQHPVPSGAGGTDNDDGVKRSRISTPPVDGNDTGGSTMSSPPSRPPVVGPTRRRQPGTAVVASPSLALQRGSRFKGDEKDVFATVLIHVLKGSSTRYSRLYGALAHANYDASADRHYFINGSGASLTRSCDFSPFTIFYIPNREDQREGLTILEQRLLQFVYCRPEEQKEADAVRHPYATDLSSLAVGGTGRESEDGTAGAAAAPAANIQPGNSTATVPCETASPPGRTPHRASVSLFPEHRVSSFIVAMQLLEDRPMRLAFLPVVIEPVPPKGTSLTPNGVTLQTSKTPGRTGAAYRREDRHLASGSVGSSEEGATNSTSEGALQAPSPTMVPVLECVIDDVLCILTEIEITVDSSFQRPSKVLLIGVSLEDVSEEGSERSEIDVNEDDGMSRDSLEGSTGSLSLDFASGTVQPTDRHDSPLRRATKKGDAAPPSTRGGMATITTQAQLSHVASKSVSSLPRHEHGVRCTLGQEFREVIHLEQRAAREARDH
ncbi:hypothetical protein GH5_05841 [Leishmania sp. Ghana 2012 LV757]|uniref:hypothetical protein n=1 Tax=Leishmania sp. Ghana 2012 LV757 TaxID=2803181 RepID=UPI001B4D9913|nr:hypothetical protein GH5_05841 [Leishmania sp. Ghana 2012 LV757]